MATKLIITDTQEFDDAVWQSDSWFSEQDYNVWLQGARDTLQSIYDKIDSENFEDILAPELYILGDVINILRITKIKAKMKKYHYVWVAYTDNLNYGRQKLAESTSRGVAEYYAKMANKGCYVIVKERRYE